MDMGRHEYICPQIERVCIRSTVDRVCEVTTCSVFGKKRAVLIAGEREFVCVTRLVVTSACFAIHTVHSFGVEFVLHNHPQTYSLGGTRKLLFAGGLFWNSRALTITVKRTVWRCHPMCCSRVQDSEDLLPFTLSWSWRDPTAVPRCAL